ncbi:competence protein ComK [Aquibacillus albus]|uniref:competence protein ComK n=1 Tax=Aquibacillus albus TaxID=1168171 RepID=UPI001959ED26
MQLIKLDCIEAGCSYYGIQEAITFYTGSQKKIPIPIDRIKNIYAFPTNSQSQFECNWFFYNHIHSIQRSKSIDTSNIKSIVSFKN